MPHTVFCQKHKARLPGLDKAPFNSQLGDYIYNHVSLKAWQEWQQEKIKIINENRLALNNPEARKLLNDAMLEFLELPKENSTS